MRSIQSLIKLSSALLAVLFLAGPAVAAAACCTVTDIDTKKGVVGARETVSGRQFTFKLNNPVLVRRIKVGQGVEADFAAGKVTVVGIDGRYPIIDTAPAARGTKPAPPRTTTQGSQQGKNTLPTPAPNRICCTIFAIDLRSGVASARDNATGRTFKFAATDKKTSFKNLKAGQGVYAHLGSKQVSLDGRLACCRITELSPASTSPGRRGADQSTAPPEEFDQGSAPLEEFDQGSARLEEFDQGSTPSGGFDQGSTPSGGFDEGSTPSDGFDQGSLQQGNSGLGEPGEEYKYGVGGGQLQGDRPWYEKDQGPVDSNSGRGQSRGNEGGAANNEDFIATPLPQEK